MARMIPLYSVSSQAEIERRAREIFEQTGRPAGRDLDIWLQAETDYRQGIQQPSTPACIGTLGQDA